MSTLDKLFLIRLVRVLCAALMEQGDIIRARNVGAQIDYVQKEVEDGNL